MHFLTKLVRGEVDEAVHRAFIRYGRGDYDGPALEISVARTGNIRVKATYQYQDLVALAFLKASPSDSITVSGVIIGYEPLNDALAKLGIEVPPFTPKRATKLYQTSLSGSLNRHQLLLLYDQIAEDAHVFCDLTATRGWAHRTKKTLPSPRRVIPLEEQLKFSSTRVPSGSSFLKELIPQLAPDFQGDLPSTFTQLRITNQYLIEELVFPPDKGKLTSSELRRKTKRKGTLRRTIQVDGIQLTREHPFTA